MEIKAGKMLLNQFQMKIKQYNCFPGIEKPIQLYFTINTDKKTYKEKYFNEKIAITLRLGARI